MRRACSKLAMRVVYRPRWIWRPPAKVAAALVKSRLSEAEVVKTILSFVAPEVRDMSASLAVS